MTNVIELHGARKVYQMGSHAVHALDGVDLIVEQGEFISIVGASGSGKSTMMHMLGCLDRLTEGSYHLSGVDMSTASDEALSTIRNQKIGFVFQQFNLLPNLSVIENVALPLAYAGMSRAERLKAAADMATRVGLGERLDHTPSELSGGQCQRVAIARALVNKPDVLFADEPTGALDSKTGEEILQVFRDLHQQGLTLVLVTHDPKVAAHADRRITLSDGKIAEDIQQQPRSVEQQSEPVPAIGSRLGLKDMFLIGLREGLLAHKLRSALTMLGVIIGVASVIAMSSFSEGSKQKQADQIRALGSNLIRIMDRNLEENSLFEARAQGSSGLREEDADTLMDVIPEIEHLALVRDMDLEVEVHREPRPEARVRAVKGEYLKVNNLEIETGTGIQEIDHIRNHRVAVIGGGLVPEGMSPEEALEISLLIGGQPYRVVGVLANRFVDTTELEAVGVNDANLDILVPLATILNRYTFQELRSELDEIQLQLENEDALAPVGNRIRQVLNVLHQGVDDFDLLIPLDLLKSKQESQKLLDILSLCISAISLVVGGIGIMNIMLASVTERLKEIGIRRAVGARAVDIRNQFLVESVLLSMAGGVAGILFAMVGVALASVPLTFPVVYVPEVVLVAFGAAFSTGLGFGAYPAIRASRENLVDILSRE